MNNAEVLARTLYGEARAGDVEDAEAIASVVMNRVGYRNWPSSAKDVCLQPRQFSCWNGGDANFNRIMGATSANTWYARCTVIAERALAGAIPDKTRTSTHYHTPAVSPKWSRNKTPVYKTQGHIFFNDIDTPAPTTAAEALDIERPLKETRTVKGGAVAAGATVLGMVYEAAGEAISGSVQAVSPLVSFFDASTVKYLLAGIAIGAIVHMVYSRWDDRQKGYR